MSESSLRDVGRVYVTGDLIAEGKLSIGDGYRAKNSELAPTGLPFARAGNIDGGFQFEDADCFPEGDLAKVGDKISQPGDVVFTSKGTVGRLAYVRDTTPRFVYAPQLCYWRVLNRDSIDSHWLYYWMHGSEFRQQMLGVKGQTDMADYVSLTDQRRMEITLPPIDRQRAISGVLGPLDDKIEQNRRTSAALERVARAMFRAWFVDFEPVKAKAAGATSFPSMLQDVFDTLPTRFIDSEIGPVPEGWTLKPLYETARFINGAAFKAEHFCSPPDGLPVVKIAELKSGITAQTEFSDRRDLDAKYRIDTSEMLYSWSGSPDTSLDTFLWTKGPGLLNQHIFRVVTESDAQKHFVYYLLKHLRQPLIEIARDKQTTGLGHVTVADMRRIPIAWPAQDLFDGFERPVGPVFDNSFALMMESEKLAEMRDYLLPKLLSGNLRVGVKNG